MAEDFSRRLTDLEDQVGIIEQAQHLLLRAQVLQQTSHENLQRTVEEGQVRQAEAEQRQAEAEKRQAEAERQQAELRESHKTVEENMNALIQIVDGSAGCGNSPPGASLSGPAGLACSVPIRG